MQPAFQKLRAVRTLALGIAFVVGASAASCASDSKTDNSTGGTGGGSSGAGGTSSQMVQTIQCGASSCDGVFLVKGFDPLQPCCVGDACGLDSTFISQYGVMFSEACQQRDQPGVPGAGCPDSAELHVPNQTIVLDPLKGCCRTDTHTCGYQLDKLLGVIEIGLGCIDSTPFLDGGTAQSCDPGGGEAGGGGAGGGG